MADPGGVSEPGLAAAGEERLSDGTFFRHWSVAAPVAVVLLAHGAGEHSGRYDAVAAWLKDRGIAVFAPDHRGHGESPGHRAHIDRFSDFFVPLDTLRDRIGETYPDAPCFLVGHSMGGLIAARYLLDRQDRFTGAVLSGAALAVAEPPSAPAIWINRLLAALFPTLGVLQLDASEISRDPAVVAAYRADPLVHTGKFTARFVVELFSAMGEVAARRGELRLPLLVMHGDADVMTAPAGSEAFVAGVGAEDKTLRLYPGLYHEIFNEPERETVLADLYDWLRARCPP
ncbi:alpha/beta hydrolase [Pseudohaliea rubra]|uniref:Monoacylglycerol lipase n=1 Tax=Pseudohaliea rubra DSM 19751 TaxID=1265313 RepID=A0A095X1Q5_9GAMM|nr:alpha/beta hydrolase [Pseudohaliea rubra]KGE04804.1 Monoglyceride lipase [Pseudohaliea rubra DSM 19751]